MGLQLQLLVLGVGRLLGMKMVMQQVALWLLQQPVYLVTACLWGVYLNTVRLWRHPWWCGGAVLCTPQPG